MIEFSRCFSHQFSTRSRQVVVQHHPIKLSLLQRDGDIARMWLPGCLPAACHKMLEKRHENQARQCATSVPAGVVLVPVCGIVSLWPGTKAWRLLSNRRERKPGPSPSAMVHNRQVVSTARCDMERVDRVEAATNSWKNQTEVSWLDQRMLAGIRTTSQFKSSL